MQQQMTITMKNAVEWLANHSSESNIWLLGGSCSLALQGVILQAPPNDIDIFADQADTERLQIQWKDKAVDEPIWDETDMYHSLLSHYEVDTFSVELVGQFRVRSIWCTYQTAIRDTLIKHAPLVQIGNQSIRLTPLVHELLFNLLRGRPDRIERIAACIQLNLQSHISVVKSVLAQCDSAMNAYKELRRVLPDLYLEAYEASSGSKL